MAWIYRVATNAITDHYRKTASERRMLNAVQADTPNVHEREEAQIEPETATLARCLMPMIENLPAPYHQALLLTEIEGLSQVAAAEQLGLSVSGMKSRVQRGRRKLKAALLRCCEIELNRRGDVLNYRERSSCGCGKAVD